MRVLFFQRFFAHYQWGLVKELARRGKHAYEFRGDSRDPGRSGIEVISKERLQAVSFERVRTWQVGGRIAFQPAAVRAALLGSHDALILEGAIAHPTAWAAMRGAQHRGKRVLFYTHGWTRTNDSPLIEALRTRFLRAADGLLLYGQRAKNIGLAHGIPPEKMYVAFNCLDSRSIEACRTQMKEEEIARFRASAFPNANLPIVAYVGRVRREKGLELVLAALARLNAEGQRCGFLVIGGGTGVIDLQRASAHLGVPSHFTGPVYEESRLAIMLSAARVVVAPKAAGLTVVHAMSYGIPVLTHCDLESQGPEVEAVVSGVTGAFFLPGDVAHLADKISGFLGQYDRDRWAPSCMRMIDGRYTPEFMRKVFDRAISGLPAENTPRDAEFSEPGTLVAGSLPCSDASPAVADR